ncbi:thioredoxin-like protein [Rhodofomes roseus]|uniref:Thioredoxin-like protein n=1 Tax=Rhodofomes roseus TaxID=34475 RepID=A0ABQ8KLK4_9APHY|nr:thioredoxin-like protein [Rhodofomes roseus]KAH9839207.1 thioredoxin-like protein [Rhodofomes roseus]
MASSFRRRRIVWAIILLTAGVFFYVSTSGNASFLSLPASLKDIGFSPSSSRAGQVALAKLKDIAGKKQVPEIQGLLYFVSQHPDRTLNENEGEIEVEGKGLVKVDPETAIDLDVYAPDGHRNWDAHLKVLKEDYPVIVFSKTFCPYSQRAKALLQTYELDPPPFIVELNTRRDGPMIQNILKRLTGRRTVPNVLVHGQSLGGSDDIQALHDQHKLKGILEDAGLEVNGLWAGLQVHEE